MTSRILNKLLRLYRVSRPILLVLLLAALIVFINSYPSVPEIANQTSDYREQVKNKYAMNRTEQEQLNTAPPPSPALPNTISLVSPETMDDLVNPKPEPTSKPDTTPEANESLLATTPERSEPPLEIILLTGFLNVAPLIVIATLGGFGIYLLFKYKKHLTLRSIFGAAIALVGICTMLFFILIALDFVGFLYDLVFDPDIAFWSILPLAIFLGGVLSYLIVSKRTTVFRRNMGLVLAGALMGAFLTAFLPFWIIFILLIAITLFDIYSVKFGPIKKIMDLDTRSKTKKIEKRVVYRQLATTSGAQTQTGTANTMNNGTNTMEMKKSKPEQPQSTTPKNTKSTDKDFDLMLMFDKPDWSLGLGDFVIYSMFTSAVLTYTLLYLPYYIFYTPELGLILPWVIFLLCTAGLLVGFFTTLKLLQKREYLPGLPFSIGSGFVVFIVCILILQLVNYIMFNEFAIIF